MDPKQNVHKDTPIVQHQALAQPAIIGENASASHPPTAPHHPAASGSAPVPFTTTDASGYPDKRDGLAAHSPPTAFQDPHAHHKHHQVQGVPHGHDNSSIGKPMVEIQERFKDPELPMETAVPNFIK
ncbi:hypothetical protein BGZ72_004603 [Mortierella alpina]|nr:hypothetical protein BGZ72_004603 [Mortierella alpina]